jgi:hypothetical protein
VLLPPSSTKSPATPPTSPTPSPAISISPPTVIVAPPVANERLLRPVTARVPKVPASLESNVMPAPVDTTTPLPRSDDSANDTAPPLYTLVPVVELPEETPTAAEPETETSALAVALAKRAAEIADTINAIFS